jgi:hypothetical protein
MSATAITVAVAAGLACTYRAGVMSRKDINENLLARSQDGLSVPIPPTD